MAEFKTAEQYVVDKLETTERELETIKSEHEKKVENLLSRLNKVESDLTEAYNFLSMFRDFITLRKSDYFGIVIDINGSVYRNDNPEMYTMIGEYFDIRPEEDEDNE